MTVRDAAERMGRRLDEHPILGSLAVVAAVIVAALVITVGIAELVYIPIGRADEAHRADCIERGGRVVQISRSPDLCVTPDGRIVATY